MDEEARAALDEIGQQLGNVVHVIGEVAEILERIDGRQAAAVAAEKEAAALRSEEEGNWKQRQLKLVFAQECFYCKAQSVYLLRRGTEIFGCVRCVGDFLASLAKK
jgi:hypothetical protein